MSGRSSSSVEIATPFTVATVPDGGALASATGPWLDEVSPLPAQPMSVSPKHKMASGFFTSNTPRTPAIFIAWAGSIEAPARGVKRRMSVERCGFDRRVGFSLHVCEFHAG
jgi:hypothetical protein